MTAIRCSKCDTVFDGTPYGTEVQTHGHPECPNPVCNPKFAERLAAQRAQEDKEHAEYLQWRADKAAENKAAEKV